MAQLRIVPLLLACSWTLAAKSYVAERYDVRVQILPNATLRVSETVRFRFQGGDFSFVSREVRKRHTDGIFNISASMDGEIVRPEIEDTGRAVKVVWRFHARQDSSHAFTLGYGVAGPIRKDPDQDVLFWEAIPEIHEYPILGGEIVVEYPERAGVAGPPEVPHAIERQHEALRSVFTLPELAPNHGVPVWVSFQSGFAPHPPRWQAAEQERRELVSRAWATGIGVALVAVVIGILWLIRLGRSIPPNIPIPSGTSSSRGDDSEAAMSVPPAVAARLAGATSGIQGHLGTLFDLARRGVLSVREGEPRRFRGRKYEIQPGDLHQPMLPFESVLVGLVFGDSRQPRPREFSSFIQALTGSGGKVSKLLEQHMVSIGLLDAERIAVARRRQIGALLWTVAGLLAGIAGFVLSGGAVRSGPADMVTIFAAVAGMGAAAFVVGVVGLIVSAKISALTQNGVRLAAPCRRLRTHIANSGSTNEFERFLPFALAFGCGTAWVKRMRKQGHVALPPWFEVEDGGLDVMAFMDFVSSSSASADASSAGSDGGGASGGGSSSAG